MTEDTSFLLLSAAGLGVLHTLTGPDHYVPFVALARARGWSAARTAWITLGCGAGHLAGSVALGLVASGLGVALERIEAWEDARGSLAAWALVVFGLVYLAWGLRRAWRGREHAHPHTHADGTRHTHAHDHRTPHAHPHDGQGRHATPWVLFIIFVLGPCEPLVPLLAYPAMQGAAGQAAAVGAAFGAATLATMVGTVLLARAGAERLPLAWLERYAHALAGAAIGLCGAGIVFLGL